jgi:hypothetical protein
LALADVIQAETDGDALHAPHPVSISANQQVGTTVEYPFSAVIQDTNGSTNNVFSRPGDTVRVTIARTGAWVATPDGTPSRFDFTAYGANQSGTIAIAVPRDACGETRTMTVTFTGSQSTNGKVLIPNTDSTTYTITGTGTCGPVDSDRDGVPDAIDNCPNIANTNQADTDLDGLGDLCDPNAFPPSVHKHADPDLVTGPEGYAMTTGGSFDDLDGTSPQVTQSDGRGDISDEGNGNWSWSLTPADEGRGDVTVQAYDGQHRTSDSFSWRALNVAPTADITNTGPIDEGSTATISLTNVFDPSSVDTAAGFQYAFNCDGGELPTSYDNAGTTTSIDCSFPDDGTYTVSARVFDEDGGSSDYATDVVVRNVAPTLTDATLSCGAGTACLNGNLTTLGFSWSDPAGAHDTYHYDVDWGDGSAHATDSSVTSPVGGVQHTYPVGTFTLTIHVSDEDGGTSDAYTEQVSHLFDDSGLLAPLGNGRSSFKLGSTIPVKLRVSDCAGATVPGLAPRIHLALNGQEASQLSGANGADATLRYLGGSDGQYLLTLSTKKSQFANGQDLPAATYHLWVDAPEIGSAEAWFDLR